MYKKPIAKDWFPLQVVCPNCGKVGTTEVTAWDGKEVSFICRKDKVKWAQGCEFIGKISPFDGAATMPFKVEWAAKWWTFGVTIEGAGKDHASAGGTYDIARKICKDVFDQEPPLALPYEFFLMNGKKMSSSKGLGLTGEDLLEVLPPQIARFLMIKTPPNQAVEFNPNKTLIIPKLYDDYQKSAESNEDYLRRSYNFSQIKKEKKPPKTRFLVLAQFVQMPNMQDQIKKKALMCGQNTQKSGLKNMRWNPKSFLIQEKLPDAVNNLSEKQKEFLRKVLSSIKEGLDPEEFQKNLYEWAKELGLSSREAFSAIYLSFLGKDHGPKAGWLILSLDMDFVRRRLRQSSK